jgi:hypothetical protein
VNGSVTPSVIGFDVTSLGTAAAAARAAATALACSARCSTVRSCSSDESEARNAACASKKLRWSFANRACCSSGSPLLLEMSACSLLSSGRFRISRTWSFCQ